MIPLDLCQHGEHCRLIKIIWRWNSQAIESRGDMMNLEAIDIKDLYIVSIDEPSSYHIVGVPMEGARSDGGERRDKSSDA